MVRTGGGAGTRARRAWDDGPSTGTARRKEHPRMSKRGRKRRSRKGNAANHGNRPNA
ncbi:hypothetical protein NUM3379_11000 [Kineococcus sp. NUM-3379]